MIVNQITDAQLTKAATMVRKSMLSALPRSEDCDHTFSNEFEQKICAMQHRAERKNRHRRIIHRVAAAIVAILVGFSLLCALNSEVRATIRGWIKEVVGDMTYYWFQGEKTEVLPYYELTYIPEGYELIQDTRMEGFGHSRVYRQKGNIKTDIVFSYDLIREDTQLIVDINGVPHEVRNVQINGCRGEFWISSDLSEESHGLLWVDEEAGVYFTILSVLEPEEMLHIAESVILVK